MASPDLPEGSTAPDGSTAPGASRRKRLRAVWSRHVAAHPYRSAVAALLLLVVAACVWLGFRILNVKGDLEALRTEAQEIRDAGGGDPARLTGRLTEMAERARDAAVASQDPVWRAAEILPMVGRNLTVVRELSMAADHVLSDAAVPLAEAADPDALGPVDGRIDLDAVRRLSAAVSSADSVLSTSRDRLDAVGGAGTIGPVSAAYEEVSSLLATATSLTAEVRPLLDLAPSLLGADGPRSYLVMLQNNAEARPLGGNPAALVLLQADDGRISLTEEASSLDFPRNQDPPIAIDPQLTQVYYAAFPRYVMDITTRPDFPTAASLAKGYWERYIGGEIDGVASFDPVALGYLLKASGPVTLATGDILDSDNAVSLLLSDVYAKYPEARDQDRFFAQAASAVFDRIFSGGLDGAALIEALQRSIEERRLSVWSADPAEQRIVAGTPLANILAASNDERTTVGVYFMDQSSSKMDYYLDTAVSASADRCTSDRPSFRTSVTLTSDITLEQARRLPGYVASYFFGPDRFQTEVYVLGPVGAKFVSTDSPDALVSVGEDLGRPVVRLSTFLAPTESRTFVVDFEGGTGTHGPLQVVGTPMIRPTEVTLGRDSC